MHNAQGGCALCHPCWWEVDLSPSSQHCISETLARFLNSCLKGMSGRTERKAVVLDILVTLPPPLYRQETPLGVEERWKISTGLLFRRSLCSLRSLANTFFFMVQSYTHSLRLSQSKLFPDLQCVLVCPGQFWRPELIG